MIAEEYSVSPSTIKRNANFAKVIDILPEEVKHDILSGEEKISRAMTDTILDFDTPTQKKFLKEVESGTPIKEAVKKVDPEQKRKENDERIRREMERERELREKTKFSTHVRKFHDITTGTKQQILDNMHLIPENVEIWVIYKKETAEERENAAIHNFFVGADLWEVIHAYTEAKIGEEIDFATTFPVEVENAIDEIDNYIDNRMEEIEQSNS